MSQVGNHPTTPLPPKHVRDAEMASAFMDLESAVRDLRRMSALMKMAAEDTVYKIEGPVEQRVRECSGLTGYRLYMLTQDQADGLEYAINHTFELIKALHDKYDSSLEQAAA